MELGEMNMAHERSLTIFGWAALAFLLLPVAAQAQGGMTRGGFVIVSRTDTVAVEQFERGADILSGEVFGPNGRRFRYAARLRPDGTVASVVSSLDWGWWTHSVMQFTGDTIRVSGNLRGRPQQREIVAGGRTMPMFLPSFALLEQLLRSRRADRQAASVRLMQFEQLDTTSWTVAWPSPDSATVVFPGFGEAHIAMLPDGSIASGVIAALGWNATRTAETRASTPQAAPRRRDRALPFTSFDRCNEATGEALTRVELPGTPVMALTTPDGCWLVASLTTTKLGWPGAIALFRRSTGAVSLARVLPLEAAAYGIALTHDGSLLMAAAGDGVVFVDVQRLIMGRTDAVLGELRDGGRPVRFYLNASADDRLLFVSDEAAQTITVVDLVKARESGFAATAVVGRIPVGQLPIALTFSPDQRYLYTTSQIAPARLGWARECPREGSGPRTAEPVNPQGAVLVVDVERAKIDPVNAVIAAAPAGCSPVRLVLSPAGDVAYVTARNSDALLAFDTRKLREAPMSSLLSRVPVGSAPVGVAVVDEGARIIVANSNRFGGAQTDGGYLSVVDAARMLAGAAAVVGTISVDALPRELTTTPDRRTLLLTNFSSSTLQLVDWDRAVVLPIKR
jgi:DNA-binding beta-propeller fold protein YncE